MKTLVINQDIQTSRMTFQKNQLTSLGLEFERVSSYPISGEKDPIFLKYYHSWQRPLSVSEVSCFLSHKKAWEIVLDSNEPMLILEDDAWLDPRTFDVLKELNKVADIDYATLEVTGSNRKKLLAKRPSKTISEVNILRLYQGRSGAGGYVLWPEGARKLLDKTSNNKIGLADKFICACYSLKAYQVEPALIIQLDQCAQHGITPPLQVQTTIVTKTRTRSKFNLSVKCKARRIIGELKIGINLLLHCFGTERRKIILSENFKNRAI